MAIGLNVVDPAAALDQHTAAAGAYRRHLDRFQHVFQANRARQRPAGARRPGVSLHGAQSRGAREGAVPIHAGRVRSRVGRRRRSPRGLSTTTSRPGSTRSTSKRRTTTASGIETGASHAIRPRRLTSIRRGWFYALALGLAGLAVTGGYRLREERCGRAGSSSKQLVDQRTRNWSRRRSRCEGEGSRRGGDRGQERVPRQHEP